MNNIEAFLLYGVLGVLSKSALEDIRTLTISREWLFGGWVLLAMWRLSQGGVGAVLLVLGMLAWGLGYGPGWLGAVFLLAAPYWPLLLLGAGARENLAGEGDLVALSLAALYSPWAGWLGFVGLLIWLAYQRKMGKPWAPALPGLLLGVAVFFMGRFIGG